MGTLTVEVTVDLARALLAEQVPELAEFPAREAARGWDNAMFRLGDEYALRLPHRESAAQLVEHEAGAINVLGPRIAEVAPDVAVPLPIFEGNPSPALGYPYHWSVVRWVNGVVATETDVEARRAWAPTLATVLSAIHVPQDAAKAPKNPFRGTSLQARRQASEPDQLAERLAVAPQTLRTGLVRAWQVAVQAPEYPGPPVWLHGDPHPGNLVVEPGDPDRLAGLVDFGDVTAGDPASDLGALWLTFDTKGREEFRAAKNPDTYDEHAWTRSAGWAFLFATSIIEHADRDPALVKDALRVLTELAE